MFKALHAYMGFEFRVGLGNQQLQSGPTLSCGPGTPDFSPARKGVPPGEYTYRFLNRGAWTPDQLKGLEEGVKAWNEANAKSGRNTTFREWKNGDPEQQINVQKGQVADRDGKPVPAVSHFNDADPQTGFIAGGLIVFNTNVGILYSKRGYQKATLHEIGHFLGLKDADGKSGSSVMNNFAYRLGEQNPLLRRDDYLGNLPLKPTPCDALKAAQAATRPWP